MRLAIMQPYFFPYLGYFSLIKNTDQFILLDTVQFIRHGWIERNRILKQNESWLYIQVPIIRNEGRNTVIKDIRIDNLQNWKQRILSQLQTYKKLAPNYFRVIRFLKKLFAQEFKDIVTLNRVALKMVCDELEIENNISVLSEMNLTIEEPTASDEWALNICKALGNIDEYWNPMGGQNFFERAKYENAGISLKFQLINPIHYSQNRETFEPDLSIIDVMMFKNVNEIQGMLYNYQLK